MLKRVGFFAERDPSGEAGSIFEAIRDVPDERDEEIADYLDAGHLVLALMEGAPDVVTGEYGHPTASGAPSPLSDGVWVWRLDLAHYLRTHHVSLPESSAGTSKRTGSRFRR